MEAITKALWRKAHVPRALQERDGSTPPGTDGTSTPVDGGGDLAGLGTPTGMSSKPQEETKAPAAKGGEHGGGSQVHSEAVKKAAPGSGASADDGLPDGRAISLQPTQPNNSFVAHRLSIGNDGCRRSALCVLLSTDPVID